MMAPFLAYVVVGWKAKRKDIMDSFDKDARLAYFKMFSRSEEAPSLDTVVVNFETLYSQWYGRRFFWVPGILLFVVILIEITFIVLTVLHTLAYLKNPLFDIPPVAIAAIAGAYMWVVNDLTSRARRLDFSPSDVQWGILRLVIAVPMGYAFAAVAAPSAGPFIAFALGAFPLTTVTLMLGKLANKSLRLEATTEETSDDIIKLQGINKAIVERLSNEDITTISQIAYCDPVQLVMRSNLNFIFVTDCMNQALAWMYLEGGLNKIRPLGLRGAVEIKHWLDAYNDADTDQVRVRDHELARAAFPKIASAINQDPDLKTLLVAFHEIAEDPFTVFLVRVWSGPARRAALQAGTSPPSADAASQATPQTQTAAPAAPTPLSIVPALAAPAAVKTGSTGSTATPAKLGILAYGSLIDDPGEEIKPLIAHLIKGVETPFNVEFARKSRSRAGAPTLVPVEKYGSKVRAAIIVLKPEVEIETAQDILYRREIDRVGTRQPYPRDNPQNVRIESLKNFHGVETVLYTKLPADIEPLTPEELAKLALASLRDEDTAKRGRDGITYLIDAKRNQIETPLSAKYEEQVLRQANVANLAEVFTRFEPGT